MCAKQKSFERDFLATKTVQLCRRYWGMSGHSADIAKPTRLTKAVLGQTEIPQRSSLLP
jgi:hypothetical protein